MRKPKLSADAQRMLKFARLSPGWQSFSRDKATAAAARQLAYHGYIQINSYSQFRATLPDGSPITDTTDEVVKNW